MAVNTISFKQRKLNIPTHNIGLFRDKHEDSWVTFMDILVDDVSLFDHFGLDKPSLITLDNNWFSEVDKLHHYELLLGAPTATTPIPTGRIPLFVCPFCGVEDDNFSCRIEFTDDNVRWYDFAFDGLREPDEAVENDEEPDFPDEFIFDREQYQSAVLACTNNH